MSLLIGLLIATVGIDPTAGIPRFTFGSVELMGGVNFIPAMIGMFAMAEVLRRVTAVKPLPQVRTARDRQRLHRARRGSLRYKINLLRGSVIGTLVGALPGAGSDIAAWISYAVSKKFSREPEKFGTGHVEGIVDAGSIEQRRARRHLGAGTGLRHSRRLDHRHRDRRALREGHEPRANRVPGPPGTDLRRLRDSSSWPICCCCRWACWRSSRSKQLLRVPRDVLMPIILMFCVVGTFAINNTVFGVGIMRSSA